MSLQIAGIVVSLITSIGALALGVLNYLQSRRDKQRRLTVKTDLGMMILPEQNTVAFVSVHCVNTGFRMVTLEECGIMLPNRHKLAFYLPPLSDKLPVELTEGKSCTQHMAASELARVVKNNGYGKDVKIQGCFRDALSTHYISAPIPFDPEKWLQT